MNEDFFTPLTVGKLELPNRLVMAPMTRNRATRDGLATPLMAEYYTQRAGAGLIITEGTQPSVRGQGYIHTPGIHSAAQVSAWRQVTGAVHDAGGRIFLQLMHAGRIGHPVLYPDGGAPAAPSPVATGAQLTSYDGEQLDHPTPRELTAAEIDEVVEEFAQAARNAVAAGFDGVELHGANGYLIHQFLADNTNLRTDGYGGSDAGRIRFPVAVARAVAEAIGPERTGLRLSPGNPYNGIVEADPLPRYLSLVRELPTDLAYLHLMEVVNRPVTVALRKAWGGTVILNPHPTPESFPSTPESTAAALAEGLADAISLATLWLANPDLADRVRAGGPYNEADPASFYGGDRRGYTDYPVLAGRPGS